MKKGKANLQRNKTKTKMKTRKPVIEACHIQKEREMCIHKGANSVTINSHFYFG